MTDLLSGTELASVELPDDVVGFGIAEISYILGRQDSPQAAMLRQKLVLDESFGTEAMRVAGVSSLVARGLLAVDGDTVQTRSAAALLEYAAARGGRWTTFGIARSEHPDLAIVVEAVGVTVLLQPRAYGTWYAGFSSDSSATSSLLTGVIREKVSASPETALYFVSETMGKAPRSVFVRRDHEASRWDAVLDADGPGTGSRKLLDDAGLDSLFAAFVPVVR
ncbi:MAG: hypothetical protein WBX27_17980 [Specibacter sp.]